MWSIACLSWGCTFQTTYSGLSSWDVYPWGFGQPLTLWINWSEHPYLDGILKHTISGWRHHHIWSIITRYSFSGWRKLRPPPVPAVPGGFRSPVGGGVCPGRSVRPRSWALPTPRLVFMSQIPVKWRDPPLPTSDLQMKRIPVTNVVLHGWGSGGRLSLPRLTATKGRPVLAELLSLCQRFWFLAQHLS